MTGYYSVYVSEYGAIVPRITAGTSAVSSFLIICLLLRSKTKLSTIYNRIMFGMSMADVLGSLAMSLTTLPMPVEMPREEEFGYKFAGTRLGNVQTCEAQGFFFTFGVFTAIPYYAALCIYYAFALGVMMPEAKIRKRVEPFLHLIPLLVGLYVSIVPLRYEFYNPTMFDSWCNIGRYPLYEQNLDGNGFSGTRGYKTRAFDMHEIEGFILAAIGVTLILVVTSLSTVLWRVFRTQRLLTRHEQPMTPRSDSVQNEGAENYQRAIRTHLATKVAVIQVVGYISVLGSTLFWPIITFTVQWKIGPKMFLFFLPLQGFFNLLIFILHKVYNYRRVHQSSSYSEILRKIFCESEEECVFLVRLSIVEQTAVAGKRLVVEELNEFDQCSNYEISTLGNRNEVEDDEMISSMDDVVFCDDSGEFENTRQIRKLSCLPTDIITQTHQMQSDKEIESTLTPQDHNIAWSFNQSDIESGTFNTGRSKALNNSAYCASVPSVINARPLEDCNGRDAFDRGRSVDHSFLSLDSGSRDVFGGTSTKGDLSGFDSSGAGGIS